jgi:hypothetical protein
MTRRRSIIGALVLCALAMLAFGAASAFATKGLTAVICEKVGPAKKYQTSHCRTSEGAGEFETVPVALNAQFAVEGESLKLGSGAPHEETGTTAEPSAKLTATIAGNETIVTCGKSTISGKVTNVTPSGSTAEMQIHGTEGVTTYTECHASLKSNPAKICEVKGTLEPVTNNGEIKTRKLTSTTSANHVVTIEPETLEGGKAIFAKFNILSTPAATCFTAANIPVTVEGKVTGQANTTTHSHLTLEEANNGILLKANGVKAFYDSTITTWLAGTNKNTVGAETIE